MPSTGLIAIEKIVERLGKTHRQRYWVKPAELRGLVKKGETATALRKVGGDPRRARSLVTGWRTSAGSTETALMRAAAARAIHGAKPVMIQRELERSTQTAEYAVATGEISTADAGEHIRDVTRAFRRGLEDEEARKSIAAMAAVAQSMYDQPKVELWRGVRSGSACARLYDDAYRAVQKDPDAEITVETGVLTSFTDDPSVARQFAHMGLHGGEEGGGFYFKVQVPRDAIVMSHRVRGLNPGIEAEREVTVLTSGSIRIRARDIVQAQDDPRRGLEVIAKRAKKRA